MSVILPGSYDPVTLGHLEIIRRVAEQEDEVYVVAFINEDKQYRFSLDDRMNMLALATEGMDNVLVSYSLGRVVDYMREHNIDRIGTGYRTDADLPWERVQAEYNMKHGGFETELIKCPEELEQISSTAVRRTLDEGGSLDGLVPPAVAEYIKEIIKTERN